MTLVGLKLFQDVLVGAVSDKTTRANSSFLRMTETGCRITAGNAHILDMVLSIGKKGVFWQFNIKGNKKLTKIGAMNNVLFAIISELVWSSPVLKNYFAIKLSGFAQNNSIVLRNSFTVRL